MDELRFRHVHLDFHTSELIPGIGSQFDPDDFADTLARAHVNSINLFGRCHHGWLYYDTQKFPERRHPHLECNLLAEQIEACHQRGIRTPIYLTVRWDHYTAAHHPEWLCLTADGAIDGTKPFDAGFYRNLCVNTGFVDFLADHTAEVCETLPTDGIWFDICFPVDCVCSQCLPGMISEGYDPTDKAQRMQYGEKVLVAFQERMTALVKSYHPEAHVFYNSGHCGPNMRPRLHTYTHLELESLPSGGWGYLHFPLTQRFVRTLGMQSLGMNGKFHTSWGDFSSYKSQAGLDFECLTMLALNAKCSIGDQLHPTGKIDQATYDLIGNTFAQVEAAEPWCSQDEAVVDLGVMNGEEFGSYDWTRGIPQSAMGAVRLLQELHQQFDVIDSQSDFARYKLLVMPDDIQVNDALAAKLGAFVAAGGALLASYKSGLAPAGDRFNLPELGVSLVGEAPWCPDFLVPGKLGAGLADTHHVMYERGLQVEAAEEAEVLCPMVKPYFNRAWDHFCSHRHTPAEGPADYPGAVRQGNCVYFMHPIFTQYDMNAPLWCKHLVGNAVELLLAEPAVRTSAPSAAVVTLNRQAAENRLVLHVLHYLPERRGKAFDVLEDVIPLYDVKVAVRVEGQVRAVSLEPQGEALEFTQTEGRVTFSIPVVHGHQLVSIQL